MMSNEGISDERRLEKYQTVDNYSKVLPLKYGNLVLFLLLFTGYTSMTTPWMVADLCGSILDTSKLLDSSILFAG